MKIKMKMMNQRLKIVDFFLFFFPIMVAEVEKETKIKNVRSALVMKRMGRREERGLMI